MILGDNCEFPIMDLLRVTLVSVKKSWGIRISLNIIRSTQVFNEVLYKNSYFMLKRFLIKMLKMDFDKINF